MRINKPIEHGDIIETKEVTLVAENSFDAIRGCEDCYCYTHSELCKVPYCVLNNIILKKVDDALDKVVFDVL
jgi:hypothetical protein